MYLSLSLYLHIYVEYLRKCIYTLYSVYIAMQTIYNSRLALVRGSAESPESGEAREVIRTCPSNSRSLELSLQPPSAPLFGASVRWNSGQLVKGWLGIVQELM